MLPRIPGAGMLDGGILVEDHVFGNESALKLKGLPAWKSVFVVWFAPILTMKTWWETSQNHHATWSSNDRHFITSLWFQEILYFTKLQILTKLPKGHIQEKEWLYDIIISHMTSKIMRIKSILVNFFFLKTPLFLVFSSFPVWVPSWCWRTW